MAACRIVYQPVFDAVDAISKAKEKYDSAASDFISAFHTAISEMEGAAKDALLSFFDKDITQFVQTDLPGAVDGMRSLLQANLDNFVDVDQQIANSISGG